VSGAKTSRPRLDQLIADALGRRVDVVVCWRLDRFGRNLRHLITAIEELNAAGVSFVSLGESIDTASPTGRLLLGVLGSFAQFERDRIRERITAGLARAKRQGQKLGRRRQRISAGDLERVAGLSVREAAKRLGVQASRVHRERGRLFQKPLNPSSRIAPEMTEWSPPQ
jgi:DNA invertase Pin-like site-specific DNA recombinase